MFNEEAGAAACVANVTRVLDSLPVPSALIVVDDGSTDDTAGVLARLAPSVPRLEIVTHARNRGYGAALQTGVETAARRGLDFVLFMDSDLTNSPADIPRFLAAIGPEVDVVKATRFRQGGGMPGVPRGRRAISRAGNAVARLLFRIGVSDCTNGFRAVRTTLARRFKLRENRFPVILEELYCCVFTARQFAEVPVLLTSRAATLRPTSFAYRPAVLWRYLKYALLAGLRIPPRGRIEDERRQGGTRAN
jgi:glycosyltransferase involved in cell wall biosynthesis